MARAVGGVLGLPAVGGDPGALEDAAGDCRGVATAFARMAGQLRHAGMSDGWSGVAAASFEGRMLSEADVMELGNAAWHGAARAFDALADDLRDLHSFMDRCVDQARDAESAREGQERAAADESAAADGARIRSMFAGNAANVAELGGSPSAASHRDEQAREWRVAAEATGRAETHQRAASDHRRELERLRAAAVRRVERYQEAADGAAARFRAVAHAAPRVDPFYGMPKGSLNTAGGPGVMPPTMTRTMPGRTRTLLPDFDREAAREQWRPSSTDRVKAINWWTGAIGGFILTSTAETLEHIESHPEDFRRFISYAFLRVGQLPIGFPIRTRSVARLTTPLTAKQLSLLGRYRFGASVLGGALAVGTAGVDDWRDTVNSGRSRTERLGHAAGTGIYVGGVATVGGVAGGLAGQFIIPVPIAGAVIGSTIVGGMAASGAVGWTPAKNAAGATGQAVTTTIVGGARGIGDGVEEVGSLVWKGLGAPL